MLNWTSDYKAEAFGSPLIDRCWREDWHAHQHKEGFDSADFTSVSESGRYLHPGLWYLYYIKNASTVTMTVVCSVLLVTARRAEQLKNQNKYTCTCRKMIVVAAIIIIIINVLVEVLYLPTWVDICEQNQFPTLKTAICRHFSNLPQIFRLRLLSNSIFETRRPRTGSGPLPWFVQPDSVSKYSRCKTADVFFTRF